MERNQKYRLIVEVHDMTKIPGQYNPFNDPVPGAQLRVKIDGDDLERIISGRIFEYWNLKDAAVSADNVWKLWSQQFGRLKRISKKAVEKFMYDIESVIEKESLEN